MYDELKNFPEYFNDLERFKSGVNISSDNKPYDKVLEGVRFFNAKLILTLRQFKSLIKEIDTHKILDITHKEILLKKFFDTHVDEYISGCLVMETDNDLKIIAESFYIGFATKFGDKLKFFSSDFYDLKKMIFDTPRLKNIYYSS